MEPSFADNAYIIDLTYAKNAADIIYDLSSCLDNDAAKNRKIFLKLSDITLNQSQLMSIKSLISSVNSTLSFLDVKNEQTKISAVDLGIIIFGATKAQAQITEPEQTYKTAEDMDLSNADNEIVESKVELNPVVSISSPDLDNIFDMEKKLNNILDADVQEDVKPVQNAPLMNEIDYTDEDYEIDTLPTMYVKQTLRSGQVLSFDGNIFVVGDAHPGSEIVATGDITVWGMLAGIAHAGSKGNDKARIRALKMNAIQLRVAQCYARRPDSFNVVFVEKTDTYTPEEARAVNGEIVIFKMND